MREILQDINPSEQHNREMLTAKEMFDYNQLRHSSLYRFFHTPAPTYDEYGILQEEDETGYDFLLLEDKVNISEEEYYGE